MKKQGSKQGCPILNLIRKYRCIRIDPHLKPLLKPVLPFEISSFSIVYALQFILRSGVIRATDEPHFTVVGQLSPAHLVFIHLSLSDADRHEALHVYLVTFHIMSAYDMTGRRGSSIPQVCSQ